MAEHTNESRPERRLANDTIPPLLEVQLLPTRIPEIQRDPLSFLLRNAAEYGDFIHYPLRLWDVIQVNHPAIIKHILQDNNRNYTKNTIQYNTLAQVTGRGLLTSDGDLWLSQRRLMQPAFHRNRLAAYEDIIVATTGDMLDRWTPGKTLDIDAAMMQVALEIVGKTLFGLDLRHEAGELTEGVLEMLEYVVYRASNPVAAPLYLPTRRNQRYKAAMAKLEGVVYDTIAQRRAEDSDRGDVLSILLAARDGDTGQPMSDRQIRDEMTTLIVAGHETIASALTWAWYLLSLSPTVRAMLEQELANVLGERLPTVNDLHDLPTTRAIFDEVLRLYPPAWLITRRALEDDTIGGQTIPAGSIVIMSPYVMHRHGSYWSNPAGFDPDHFNPEVVAKRPRFAYIPFGGGPRLCIGDNFALMEGPMILATVAQRYRLNLVPSHPVKMEALVTLRPHGGLLMTAEQR